MHQPRRTDPTPEEIQERAAAIRQGWTPEEREHRWRLARTLRVAWLREAYTVPVVRLVDLIGDEA